MSIENCEKQTKWKHDRVKDLTFFMHIQNISLFLGEL